jgi:hypothetical protein
VVRATGCPQRGRARPGAWCSSEAGRGVDGCAGHDAVDAGCGSACRSGPSGHGSAEHSPARHGPARHGPARHGPARHGPARGGPDRHGPARRRSARRCSAERDSAERCSVGDGPVRRCSAGRRSVERGPTWGGPAEQFATLATWPGPGPTGAVDVVRPAAAGFPGAAKQLPPGQRPTRRCAAMGDTAARQPGRCSTAGSTPPRHSGIVRRMAEPAAAKRSAVGPGVGQPGTTRPAVHGSAG